MHVERTPAGDDSNEQSLDRTRNLGYCDNLNNNIHDLTFRLRTQPNTAPGKYAVTFTLETNGQQQTGTYEFTVLPPATAPPHPQLAQKAIPGAVHVGKADGRAGQASGAPIAISRTSPETSSTTGDGQATPGSTMAGASSRTSIPTPRRPDIPTIPYWQHCALNLLDPYANWQVANNGNMQGFSTFTVRHDHELHAHARRRHAESALSMLATVGPQHVGVGKVDPWGIRENSYRSNAWMTDEMLGAPRWPLLQRNIDKMMGNMNMIGARPSRRRRASLHGRAGAWRR